MPDSSSIAPYIADYFGRRIGVALGVVILVIGVIIQCKDTYTDCRERHTANSQTAVPSVNQGMFIGGRFLMGFG